MRAGARKQREAGRPHRGQQRGLFTRHALEIAKAQQVRGRHQRDQGEVGLDHVRERRHLPRRTDARLDHRKFVPAGIEPRERERHAKVVVEVALGRQHRAAARPLPRPAQQQRQLAETEAQQNRDAGHVEPSLDRRGQQSGHRQAGDGSQDDRQSQSQPAPTWIG